MRQEIPVTKDVLLVWLNQNQDKLKLKETNLDFEPALESTEFQSTDRSAPWRMLFTEERLQPVITIKFSISPDLVKQLTGIPEKENELRKLS